MTNATFSVTFVEVKTGQPTLTWTSTEDDVRPTFRLGGVPQPAYGDSLSFFFDGDEYTTTVDYDHLYKLRVEFPEIPELLNGTYEARAEYTQGSTTYVTNTVDVTIDVAYTVPTITPDPVIVRDQDGFGNIFTVTPGTAAGRPIPTVSYQWYRDTDLISGETGLTYTRQEPADDDKTIYCKQTAVNSEGSVTETSNGIFVAKDLWTRSTVDPAIVDKAFSASSHTFTGVDFLDGLGIVFVASSSTTRTITGVTINGNAATLVVASDAVHYATMWKCDVPSAGNYDVVVTGSGTLALLGITCGTLVDVNTTETATAVKTRGTGNQPHSTSSSLTVPAGGVGLVMFRADLAADTTWSVGIEESDKSTTLGNDMTMSVAFLGETGTPTVTSHAFGGTAMVAAAWDNL